MNNVSIIGNLTRDPELKYIGETPVCKFGVAWNERRKNKQSGEYESIGNFFEIEAWNGAEACARYLTKGRQVAVDGELRYNSWTNESGEKRSKVFIRAQHVDFIVGKDKADGDGTSASDGTARPERSLPRDDPDRNIGFPGGGEDDDVPW